MRTKPSGNGDGRTKGTKRGDGGGSGGIGRNGGGNAGGTGVEDGGKKKRGRASFHRRTGNTLSKNDNNDEGEEADIGEEETEEDPIPTNLLVTQKEHCLVGIRGTVRRKTDGWFVHCNVGKLFSGWSELMEEEDEERKKGGG